MTWNDPKKHGESLRFLLAAMNFCLLGSSLKITQSPTFCLFYVYLFVPSFFPEQLSNYAQGDLFSCFQMHIYCVKLCGAWDVPQEPQIWKFIKSLKWSHLGGDMIIGIVPIFCHWHPSGLLLGRFTYIVSEVVFNTFVHHLSLSIRLRVIS